MPEWIIKYWVEWAFGAVLAIIGFLIRHLYARIKKEREAREALEQKARAETDAVKAGMKALLRRQVLADCKQAAQDGFCPADTRDTITAMYDAYHGLGGNGSVSDAYSRMRQLPLVRPDHPAQDAG